MQRFIMLSCMGVDFHRIEGAHRPPVDRHGSPNLVGYENSSKSIDFNAKLTIFERVL